MRTSRTLPVVAIAVLLGALLTACDPTPTPRPTDTGTGTPSATEEPTPDPTESRDPDSEPDAEPEPEPAPSLDATDRANIRAAIESGNTAAIEAYFANPVDVIIMSSECCGSNFLDSPCYYYSDKNPDNHKLDYY